MNESVEIRISAVKKLIRLETESKFKMWEQSIGISFALDDEWGRMKQQHFAGIDSLPLTRAAVDEWLRTNRRVSLTDWAWSL